ncbi:hypothetical protein [Olsenella porci]|jgi:polyhydroxyalkanoate synthesis regulator phasin|uniref:Poly(Hydroxyalcanoate) granule associated protein (Phasin) n=1 Tax=Olsenella porci TaxID=2652279 RepID=A0A6N7XQL4_9ACTN|nr:hypothetical protein [Olsenella porci]MCI1997521.1 hypothetical protein [Olsenella sp.]MST72239.1 hypothetical protein [Olsenella porci]
MAAIDDLTEGARKAFLLGVGAVAMGAEKTQGVVNDLVKKGEMTVEQGKAINEELHRKVSEAAADSSDAALKEKLRGMTPEERAAWVKKAQQYADDLDAETVEVEVDETDDEHAKA